ncbi:MAG TPA: PQQ-dependent sugar dehydrogenase, partial [Pyrinomonadaceae bacterium]|nr:PQQ-dependent sugar dehydrogenase [Pyrinomonadaceae bacterium]
MSIYNTEFLEVKVLVAASLLWLLIASVGCNHGSPPGRGAGEVESLPADQVAFRVEPVIGELQVPWSIVWDQNGRMLFTERPGRVRVFAAGKLQPQPLFTVPDLESSGESGLMSIALHPDFGSNAFLYLSYAYKQNQNQAVRVVRYRETPNGFTDRKIIIEEIPAAQYHAGCRVRFGPDGKLYITTGDATERELAQRLDSLAGKTLRLNDDGS